MTYRLSYIAIIALLILTSCQKEDLPESTIGTPVFISSYELDGQGYNLVAGEANLALNPSLSIENDTAYFINKLLQKDCENCGPGFEMSLRSPIPFDSLQTLNLQSELENWDYGFADAVVNQYTTTVSASAFSNTGNVGGFWYLDGILISADPSDSIVFTVEDPGNYELSHVPLQGCDSPSVIDLSIDEGQVPCFGHIEHSIFSPFLYTAIPSESFDLGAISYQWFAEDTVFQNAIGPEFQLNTQQFTYPELCVTMSDGNCSFTTCYALPDNPVTCQTNIQIDQITLDSTQTVEPIALVGFIFISDDGTIYTTHSEYDEDDFIFLHALEPYSEPNNPDKNYLKAEFQFSTKAVSETGQEVPVAGNVQVAIEIPN